MLVTRKRKMRYVALIFTLITLVFLEKGSCLYFLIGETERKCFIDEIPDETPVIVNYKVELYDPKTGGFMPSSPGIGMLVEARDPEDKLILSRKYSSEGRFSFTSQTPGEHIICLYSNSTKWFGSGTQLKVHLDIQVGEHAIDYSRMAHDEKLSELQVRLKQLLKQVDQITKEQNYQRLREERFRQTSESTNSRVLWWSLTQTCILVAMGTWQMKHLRSFFEIFLSGTLITKRDEINLDLKGDLSIIPVDFAKALEPKGQAQIFELPFP